MVRIRSEHAIGFLKGRFQSLKNLRINIKDEDTHKFATYWVIACIGLHSFAMTCEAEERVRDGQDDTDAADRDPFVQEGLSSDSDSSSSENSPEVGQRTSGRRGQRATTLANGRKKRQQLKRRLLRHLTRRRERYNHSSEGSEDDTDSIV